MEVNINSDGYHQIIVRKFFDVKVDPYVMLSPFEVIDLVLTIRINPQLITLDNGHKLFVCFNLMQRKY